MPEDHLDKTTSVSAELTDSGVRASANIRTVNALDRLVGSGMDWLAARIERGAANIRARSDTEVAIIKSSASVGIELIKGDPELARQMLLQQVGVLLHRQGNKEEVVAAAIEDLRSRPPNEEQSSTGGEKLDGDFLNRFERFAEDASSEELRAKWGKVLAAEVRKPGTFSPKVMRTVDELDPATARLFDEICQNRLGEVIPKCLVNELSFVQTVALTTSGLLVDPGFTGLGGQIRFFMEISDSGGTELWLTRLGPGQVTIPRAFTLPKGQNRTTVPLSVSKQKPAIPVYILTEAGVALASILDDQQYRALAAYCDLLADFLGNQEVRAYHPAGDQWQVARVLNGGLTQDSGGGA